MKIKYRNIAMQELYINFIIFYAIDYGKLSMLNLLIDWIFEI